MPRAIVRLFSFGPMAAILLGDILFWAITADGAAAAIVVVGTAMTLVLGRAIKDLTPLILAFLSGLTEIRKVQSSQGERIDANEERFRAAEARAATAEARAAMADRENDVLRDQIVLVLNRQDHDVAAFGEALLIQNGDMNDPVKAKDKATP